MCAVHPRDVHSGGTHGADEVGVVGGLGRHRDHHTGGSLTVLVTGSVGDGVIAATGMHAPEEPIAITRQCPHPAREVTPDRMPGATFGQGVHRFDHRLDPRVDDRLHPAETRQSVRGHRLLQRTQIAASHRDVVHEVAGAVPVLVGDRGDERFGLLLGAVEVVAQFVQGRGQFGDRHDDGGTHPATVSDPGERSGRGGAARVSRR